VLERAIIGQSPSARVLYIEDDIRDVELVRAALRRGAEVDLTTTASLACAEHALREGGCDLVLCDFHLPGFDAHDVLRLLTSLQVHAPLVLVTGALSDDEALRVIEAGAADYVLKSNLARLPLVLKRMLREQDLEAWREASAQAYRQSHAEYKMLFQSSPQPMFVLECSTLRLLNVNLAAARLYGYEPDELRRLRLSDLLPLDAAPPAGSAPSDCATYTSEGVVQHCRKDGETLYVELHTSETSFGARPARLVLVRDVTDRQRLEEDLRQAQKMEAVGQLAGGIAHDFNNLLMVISGFAELLHARTAVQSERRNVQQILDAAARATRLVAQLLTFSRKQVLAPRVLDLNDSVRECEKLLRRVLGEHVEFSLAPGAPLHAVRADPSQMEQVILNLGINARDAMPLGGKLAVETRNQSIDEAFCARHPGAVPGDYVRLSVSDSGCGMDAATLQHIFEPFFTTKRDHGGTGLGLATVYGIVKHSGGFIIVDSEVGRGTTFLVYFPAVDEPAEPASDVAASSLPEQRGNETVLVVEDEDGVREAMTQFLRSGGYTVLPAACGDEALEAATHFPGAIDLMVTDVVMPRMSGRELAKRMAVVRPATRVLYISGYTGTVIPGKMQLEATEAFLEKPFTWRAFSRKIREVLATTSVPVAIPPNGHAAHLT
jgi:two-component system cell cycle sensor histidine kinase/response regulator CckA